MGLNSFISSINTGYNFHDKLSSHVLERSAAVFDRLDAARAKITSREDLEAYASDARSRFEAAIGGIPYDPSLPLNAEITGVIRGECFDIEKIIFQSRPGVYVTGNLYLPHKRRNPCGAVLFNPGHSNEGKAYAGYQTVARSIASAGLIVFLIDPVGQGERHSYFEPAVGADTLTSCTQDHQYAGHQIMLTDGAPVRYFIADARRAVDYLISRPEVDADAIGLTGSSGGGTMTCNMMVCEPRARAAAPGTFLMTRRQYLYACDPQDAEQIWMGNEDFAFDHADVLACFAPKPMLALTDDADFFPIEGTIDVIREAKPWYALYGAENEIGMVTDHSTHAYTRFLAAEAAKFFARTLNGEDRCVETAYIEPLPMKDTFCTASGQVAADYPDARFLFHENLDRLRELSEVCTAESAREFVRRKVYAYRKPVTLHVREFPAQYASGMVARQYFWFTQDRMPNFGILIRNVSETGKTLPVKICLFDRGTLAIIDNMPKIRSFLNAGYAVFVPDVSGIGRAFPDPYAMSSDDVHAAFGTLDTISKNLFFIGDSLCALRLYDLERLPEVLATIPNLGEASVYARSNSGILANLHGLLHPDTAVCVEDCQTITDVVTNRYYEEYDLAGFMLPGVAPYAVKLGI